MLNKYTYWLATVFVSISLASVGAKADGDICAGGHTRSDRDIIVGLQDTLDSQLNWLASIAENAASNQLTAENMASLYSEFEFARVSINSLGQYNNQQLSERGKKFIIDVVNTDYLGIPELFTNGAQGQEALFQIRETLNSVNVARGKLALCLHGSWDRLTIVDSQRFPLCGGGFSIQDFSSVLGRFVKGIRTLVQIEEIGRAVLEGIVSTNQAKVLNYDLQYYLEDLELLGSVPPLRVSQQTQRFIRTVFDPFYLGVKNLSIDGPTSAVRQLMGLLVVNSVTKAVGQLTTCLDNSVGRQRK